MNRLTLLLLLCVALVGATVSTSSTLPTLTLSGPSITAGSGTGVTVADTGSVRTLVYKVTVSYTNCVTADVTCDVTIATLPAKTFLKRIVADMTTKYICAQTCTTATLSGDVGTSAGGAQLLASFDADSAAAVFGDADAELGTATNAVALVASGALIPGVLGSWTGTTTVIYRLTSAVGNLAAAGVTNLSQGSVTFYLVTETMP